MTRIGISILALVGGLWFVDYGMGRTPAAAAPPLKEDALAGVTQNWDKNLPAAQRFTALATFNNEAVRDNETGLVWEKSPASTTYVWFQARLACINKSVGDRKGWRLPSVPELASLIEPSNLNPSLPTGHPFTNVQSLSYWSATSMPDSTYTWLVNFSFGEVNDQTTSTPLLAWCVRGGMNADKY